MPIPLGILAVAGAGAGDTGAFDLLETTILSSTATSVTFSNLGNYSAYKHLQLRMVVANATTSDTPLLTFNGVAGTSYAFHQLRTDGTGPFSVGFSSRARIEYLQNIDNSTNRFYPSIIDILDFSNTSKNKTARFFSYDSSGSNGILYFGSGLFNSTNAITSITITMGSNFAVNSRFSLYGMK